MGLRERRNHSVKRPNLRFAAVILVGNLFSCAGASGQPTLAAATGPAAGPASMAPPAAEKAPAANDAALAVVNAADRSDADKKLDGGRHPAELLTFFKIAPGMKVAEIAPAPIPYLTRKGMLPENQRYELAMLQEMNRRHAESRESDPELEARIEAFELAFRMQAEAPEAFDVDKESEAAA